MYKYMMHSFFHDFFPGSDLDTLSLTIVRYQRPSRRCFLKPDLMRIEYGKYIRRSRSGSFYVFEGFIFRIAYIQGPWTNDVALYIPCDDEARDQETRKMPWDDRYNWEA